MAGGIAYFWVDIVSNSAIAVLLSAFLASTGTILAIRSQRRVASRQATISMLMSIQFDKDYIESIQVFSDLTKEKDGLENLFKEYLSIGQLKRAGDWANLSKDHKKRHNKTLDDFDKVITILNGYELIAIGIREGIYDEAIFKRWFRGSLITHWNDTKIFIERLRGYPGSTAKAKAFCEFDDLASKWDAEGPLQRKQRHFRLWGGKNITIHSSH